MPLSDPPAGERPLARAEPAAGPGESAGWDAPAAVLWHGAPIAMAYFDTDLRYRRVNRTLLDDNGGTAELRLGRTPREVHGAIGGLIETLLLDVRDSGEQCRDVPLRGRLWHGSEPEREWRLHGQPVTDATGAVTGIGLVLVDVTEVEGARRRLASVAAEHRHVVNRYQSLLGATSDAVWIRAADGRVVVDSPALRAITGQSARGHAGWGFLDAVHPADREAFAAAWRAAAAARPAVPFAHEYRLRTGRGYRWFRTRAVPVDVPDLAGDAAGVIEWVGTETDVDDARRAAARMAVLSEASRRMSAALDPEAELAALADAVVPEFADVCRVYLLDPDPLRRGGVLTGRRSVVRMAPGVPPSPSDEPRFAFAPEHPIAECARTRKPVLVSVPARPEPMWRAPDVQARWGLQVEVNSMLVAPVLAGGNVVAALLFIARGDRPPFTADDLSLVRELADRTSAAIETAARFQQNREVSVALQSAMLADPPHHPGVRIEARYLPAAAEMQVGGDWHDTFALPDGDLAVVVGDVAGHDLPAAVTMGQLRSMLRGLAYDGARAGGHGGADSPAEVLASLDRAAVGLGVTRFATALYGRIRREPGGAAVFRWSSAGHPPPLLVSPGGVPRVLDAPADVVLGVDPTLPRREHSVRVPVDATLVLYTDGLAERRTVSAERATDDLLDLVRRHATLPLPEFCDHLVRFSPADTGDDIALLAVRVGPAGEPPAGEPVRAQGADGPVAGDL